MNDGISPTICSLTYITVDQVAAVAASLGVVSLLAKIDCSPHIGLYQYIPRIDHYWGFGGGAQCMLMPCSCLDSTWPLKYLQPLLMHCSGFFNAEVSHLSGTT